MLNVIKTWHGGLHGIVKGLRKEADKLRARLPKIQAKLDRVLNDESTDRASGR